MPSILTIAHLTLHEARRRLIVRAAFLCALAFLTVFSAGVFFAAREMADEGPLKLQLGLALLTTAGMYAASFLSVLFAVLLPLDALSGDIDSGVMQTLASKPIRRSDIVLGKWLGHWLVVVVYVVLICLAVGAVTSAAGRTVRLNVHLALPFILLQVTLMLTISIAGGTRLSTVTNGVVALGFFGVAFIGGWIEQIGSMAGVSAARMVGIAASLISPADSMWRLGVYYLQPAIVRGTGGPGSELGPLGTVSVPNLLMVWWAVGFTVLTLAYAVRSFDRRAL